MNKHDICKQFLLDPTVNPISSRKIEINGPTFKKLTKLCYELKYDNEIEELLNSLTSDEKVGLTGLRDIEQMIILSYDLETIIKLLKTDHRLRLLIYELIPNIIENYRNNRHFDDIIEFLTNLVEMKEFSLLDRTVIELKENTDLITNYNLAGILEFMEIANFNKKLDNLLFDLISDIVEFYINTFVSTENDRFVEFKFNEFIKKLLIMGRVKFAKKAMEEFVNILGNDNDYHLIIQDIFYYDDSFSNELIEGYFKILPIDYNVDYLSIEQTIEGQFYSLNDDEIELYMVNLIRAIINLDNYDLLNSLENVLIEVKNDDYLSNKFSMKTYHIINDLIDEAKRRLNL